MSCARSPVPDPLERVTNLLALLLESRAPLTLRQISDEGALEKIVDDRVTRAQTQIGVELARLPEDRARLDTQSRAADTRRAAAEDANLAESISGLTQADAAHRAALGALANAGRLSLMDYLK